MKPWLIKRLAHCVMFWSRRTGNPIGPLACMEKAERIFVFALRPWQIPQYEYNRAIGASLNVLEKIEFEVLDGLTPVQVLESIYMKVQSLRKN